jgi:antitoxin CptB
MDMPVLSDPESLRKKLYFRSHHRGSKELDIIFGRFADRCLGALTAAQLAAYGHLLDQPDVDVYNWLLGHDQSLPSSVDADIVARVRTVL